MKCLETDARRRYSNAGELARDLERFLDGEPIQAKPLRCTRGLPWQFSAWDLEAWKEIRPFERPRILRSTKRGGSNPASFLMKSES